MIYHSFILAFASLGSSKLLGLRKPALEIATTPNNNLLARQYCDDALQISCDGNCISYHADCCRLGDGSYCDGGALCDPSGACCMGGVCDGDDTTGGGLDGLPTDAECDDDEDNCEGYCIPAGSTCCDFGDGSWCPAGVCTNEGVCDISDLVGDDDDEDDGSNNSNNDNDNGNDDSNSGNNNSSDDGKDGDKDDNGKDNSNKGGDEDEEDAASAHMPNLLVGLVAVAPLLL